MIVTSFRYRGYVYDEESALYYLKSRYYNPVFGRFVNADDEFVVEIERFHHNQYNLFAYCNNDPVFDR
ncbi:MAG: RHS repeat-associated core domain-containing protein [Christensenellales bacterium]